MSARKTGKQSNHKVTVALEPSHALMNQPCDLCSGYTETVHTWARVQSGPYEGFQVCESCLEGGDADARLRDHIERLQHRIDALSSLLGRLELPSFEEWWEREIETEFECYFEIPAQEEYSAKLVKRLASASGIRTNSERNACIKWLLSSGMSQSELDEAIEKAKACDHFVEAPPF